MDLQSLRMVIASNKGSIRWRSGFLVTSRIAFLELHRYMLCFLLLVVI